MEALLVDEVILPGRSSSPTPVITPVREDGGTGPGTCSLCLSAPGRYTCPRCNAPYCSLACYKGPRHTACSELFYRDSVLEALRDGEAGPRGSQQLRDMLIRLKEEDEVGEADPISGEEALLWNSLSTREKEHFNRLLKSGSIGSLIPQWKPWWSPQDMPCNKIQEISEKEGRRRDVLEMTDGANSMGTATAMSTSATSHSSQGGIQGSTEGVHCCEENEFVKNPGLHDQAIMPPVMSPIPPLCSLCRSPSPLVMYSVVNVIYGYVFSLMRHNGDVSDILLDFIGTLFSVCGALSTTAVYSSTAHALKSAVRAASDPHLGGGDNLACSAMEATSHILQGDGSKRYALATLSHLSSLLGKVRKQVPAEKDIRKGAFNAKKKCVFLAAWVNENEDCLVKLAGEVVSEYQQYLDDLTGVTEIAKGLQKSWGGKRPPEKKKLIQEISPSSSELTLQ
ncbi:zinc finger HIT domain-containing protein 2 [Hyperolius riggenbachi]|uniref:zinc finger HIT domain-containing protein 2 n=1 Tax=Hyperolius riggenbachi TaxID=752182 RepID=UPI0035A2B935